MRFTRYNVRVRRLIVFLAAAAAGLGLLSAAQGGAFPGTNGLIAYNCNSTSICRANPDGTNAAVLISTGSDPSWSANGAKLAFVQSGDVYTANADGTSQTLFESGAAQPTYSSDNATIAYVKTDGIWSKSSAGGSAVHLVTGTTVGDPAFSPNGQKLAYSSYDGTHYHIYVLTIGGSSTQLTTAADEVSPNWSPDGAKIVFESSLGIFTISSSGGSPAQIAGASSDAHDPSFSPDGTKIIYATGSGALVVVNAADGTNAQTIVGSFSNAQLPDWGTATAAAPPSTPGDTAGGPKNVSYPTITLASGDSSPVVGHSMFASIGSWSGTFPITYTYQWKRCEAADPVNGTCVNIVGATSSFYTPVPADVGWRIRVAVTASNSDGRTTQNSEVTALTIAIAARVTSTPQIQPGGQNQVDQPLSLTAGVWAGSTPIAFTYSWRRCNPVGDFESCVPIIGATASTYTPTVADLGFSLRVWITGSNVAGSDTAITNHTYPVVDKQHFAPSVVSQPEIAGVALPGRQLTANIGTYKGDAPIATTFHWYRCDAIGEACHAIGGATKVVYYPTDSDVGYTLRLFVFSANAYGKLLSQSDPTEAVAATPPHVKAKRLVVSAHATYLAGEGYDDTIIG